MKNLMVSTICLLILVIPWGIYDRFADASVKSFDRNITSGVVQAAGAGDWRQAEDSFGTIAKDWDEFRRFSAYFMDTESLNEIDSQMSKVCAYIRCRDATGVITEINELTETIYQLHEKDALTLQNIF